MLEVTCPQCGNRYTVKEERLPPQGARIKCPKCGNIFPVRPNKPDVSATTVSSLLTAPKDALDEQNSSDLLNDEVAWRVRNAGMTFTFHDLPSLQAWMNNRASLSDVKVAKGEDDFKELGDYDEVMSIDLINKFFPLGDVPKTASANDSKPPVVTPSVEMLQAPVLTSSAPASNTNFGVATASKATMRAIQKARNEENKRAQDANNKLKIFLALLVMVGCVLFALNQFGVLDKTMFHKQEIPIGYHLEVVDGVENIVPDFVEPEPEPENSGVADNLGAANGENGDVLPIPSTVPEEIVDPNANTISDEEAEAIVAAEVEKILTQARESVKKRNWPVAQTILISFIKDHPDNIEAKELLVKTYRALGQNEKADQLNADIRDLKKLKK